MCCCGAPGGRRVAPSDGRRLYGPKAAVPFTPSGQSPAGSRDGSRLLEGTVDVKDRVDQWAVLPPKHRPAARTTRSGEGPRAVVGSRVHRGRPGSCPEPGTRARRLRGSGRSGVRDHGPRPAQRDQRLSLVHARVGGNRRRTLFAAAASRPRRRVVLGRGQGQAVGHRMGCLLVFGVGRAGRSARQPALHATGGQGCDRARRDDRRGSRTSTVEVARSGVARGPRDPAEEPALRRTEPSKSPARGLRCDPRPASSVVHPSGCSCWMSRS
jgi:hypothetical protein